MFLWGQPGIGKSDVVVQAGGKLAQGKQVVQYHELQTIDFDPENAYWIIPAGVGSMCGEPSAARP